MPNNAKKGVYKEKEFEIYLLWKSLPAHFRGMKKVELKSHGIDDPFISKIIKIKNQTEFAKYFHIKDLGTLTDWNNKIQKENLSSPLLPSIFKKQFVEINEKVIINNTEELEKKIKEQEEIIKSLKIENEKYKKQPKIIKQKTDINLDKKMPNIKPQREQNIFQKIKKVFKW